MGLAAYGLVVHDGTESVRHAGRVYLVMTLAAEFALLIGLLLLYQRTGDLTPDVGAIVGAGNMELTFLGLAFAIKAGADRCSFLVAARPPRSPGASQRRFKRDYDQGCADWMDAVSPSG